MTVGAEHRLPAPGAGRSPRDAIARRVARDDRARRPERPRAASCRRSSRAASSSAWRWPARSSSSRPSCCSTSLSRRSTSICAAACRTKSSGCIRSSARLSSSSPTIRARLFPCRRASRSSTMAKLLQVATPQEVYERPANRFVAEFLGEINLAAGRERRPLRARHRAARSRAARLRRPAPGPRRRRRHPRGAARAHVALADAVRTSANGVAASVAATTYLGSAMRLGLVTRGGARLTVTLADRGPPGRALERTATSGSHGPWTKAFFCPDEDADHNCSRERNR